MFHYSSVEEATTNYISILSSSLSLLRQESKIDWIKYGDDCTRFFFARAKQRKLSTYFYTIQDATGTELEGFDQVGKVMLDYCKDLLGKAPLHRQSIDSSIITQGAVLSQDQQIDLCKPFSDLDIKETLFSIPNHKSPGPDGYSSGFFKSS